jgi:hypothetical protein
MKGVRSPIGDLKKLSGELKDFLREVDPPKVYNPVSWPEGSISLGAEVNDPQIMRGRGYCKIRGISPEIIREMRLAICTKGPFRNRIIFPVFDSGGRLIFFQGRAMWAPRDNSSHFIKTLSSKKREGSAGAGDCLLNLQYLISKGETERVLLVEGPVDCAHAWPDAVCTWGKKISERQISMLIQAGVKEVDLCWDSDAVPQMERYAPELAGIFKVRIVRLPFGCDPGILSKEEIENARRDAGIWGSGDQLNTLRLELN